MQEHPEPLGTRLPYRKGKTDQGGASRCDRGLFTAGAPAALGEISAWARPKRHAMLPERRRSMAIVTHLPRRDEVPAERTWNKADVYPAGLVGGDASGCATNPR